MPRKDKGFARLKHENIEMNSFHGSESDDDDGMRVIGGSSDCSYCGKSEGTRSRWNVVMTITVLGLLCSTAVLFMYFAYRDSQMIGRLNELEAQVQELMSSSSTDTSQPAVTKLAAQVDALAKKLNETANVLSLSVGEVNTSCYGIVNSQYQFINSKAELLDAAMKQITKTQLNVNKTMELLATVRATVDKYVETKAELDKSMGDLKQTVEMSQKNMEMMSSNMASHQAELKNLEGKVDNYTEQLTNTSLYCHHHVDQLHSLLTNMNASMATEMSIMWRKMSLINETPGNVTTSKPLDTIGHLLDDPVFMHNISLKIALMINSSISHGAESKVELSIVSQLADNFTALQQWVELLEEGLQQINHTLESVKANVSKQCCVTGSTTDIPSVTPSAVTPVNKSSSLSTDTGPSAVKNMTSSTLTFLDGSQMLQPATTTSTASNSLVTTTIKANLPATNATSVVEAFSSTIAVTTFLPSPTHSKDVVGQSIISSPTVLSTKEILVPSSTANTVVTSPVVVDNKTAILQKGINALDGFLQKFDKMDVDNDGKISFNESRMNKTTFNKIATDGHSYITVEDIKKIKARLEDELNALLEMSTTNSHIVTLSSEVQSVTMVILVTTSSQPVISSSQAVRISSSYLPSSSSSSSLVVISSSPIAALLKASPSSTPGNDLDEPDADLEEKLAEAFGELG